MKIEQVKDFDLHINTKQGREVINLINKLGIKKEVLAIFGGDDEEKQNLMIELSRKQLEFRDMVQDDISKEMTIEEYEALYLDQQSNVLERNMSNEAKILNLELQKLQDKINGYALNKIMDLAYTALIDRYYGNADLIEKTLSVLFDIKVKEIQDQPLTEVGCNLTAILIQCNAYSIVIDMNMKDAIEIIDSVINQFFNNRLHLQYVIENTALRITGNEGIDYLEYINSSKTSTPFDDVKRKYEAKKIMKKQKLLLKKLL